MPKIMLVEDDINLSEIYQARLQAEGYEIVATKDGEEALATAVKEHPDLIICDVMMPKISGFEMLDILRGTEGIKNTKVIMMTALNQAEDKARANSLGADRYLVKSQVTLEDVVQVTKDVLANESQSSAPASAANPPQAATPAATAVTPPAASVPPTPPAPVPQSAPVPSQPPVSTAPATPEQSGPTTATPTPPTPVAPVPQNIAQTMTEPKVESVTPTIPLTPPTPQPTTPPVTATPDMPTPPPASPEAASNPASEAAATVEKVDVQSAAEEENAVGQQIEQFIAKNPEPTTDSTAPNISSTPAPFESQPTNQQQPITSTNTDTTAQTPLAPSPTASTATPSAPTAPELSVPPEITQSMTEPAPEAVSSPSTNIPVAPANDGVTIPGKKVIQPPSDPSKPDLDALLIKEQLKEEQNALNAAPKAVVGDTSKPPVTEQSGYLAAPLTQAGQINPNMGATDTTEPTVTM